MLTALPESLLHAILARMPGCDAGRAIGACRALAAAVRRMPEIGIAFEIDERVPSTSPGLNHFIAAWQHGWEGAMHNRPELLRLHYD